VTGRVWVVGSLNVDLVVNVRRQPQPGQTIIGRDLARVPGGKGANQALAAARGGAPTTLISAVGDDGQAEAYLRELELRGVDPRIAVKEHQATGQAIITVEDTGENSIIVVPGANAALAPEEAVSGLEGITAGDVLLVQLEIALETAEAAIDHARHSGATVVLNPSPWPEGSELWRKADVVLVNEVEADSMGQGQGGPEKVRTLGPEGAVWDGVGSARAPRVEAVDTTGAGDAFAGALAAGLALGKPKRQALAAAVEAGARQCEHQGAQPWRL
jgi:ribokinase